MIRVINFIIYKLNINDGHQATNFVQQCRSFFAPAEERRDRDRKALQDAAVHLLACPYRPSDRGEGDSALANLQECVLYGLHLPGERLGRVQEVLAA